MAVVWAWACWLAVLVGGVLFLLGQLMVAVVAADLYKLQGRDPVRPALRALAVALFGAFLLAVGMVVYHYG